MSEIRSEIGAKRGTVVELDLVGYSDRVYELEKNFSARIIFDLNDQIQSFVDVGLTKVNKLRKNVVLATNGDNAVIFFEQAIDAHNFSKAVQEHTEQYNSQDRPASAERWFRIGCATGEVAQRNGDITGFVIAKAYRLEANAKPGGILIDEPTYKVLTPALQAEYGEKVEVPGKRNEKFQAYHWGKVSVGQATFEETTLSATSEEVDVKDVLDLFDRLRPRDQLSILMKLLKIPKDYRPPDTLTIYKRQEAILDWMEDKPDGLEKLAQELRELIKKQNPL
ncbi:MAG: hypothetical protein HC849_16925 [Oscillatoriales cyanobacterium RU_3_3]|nr:hypothetical protein [Leptolyngbyaceae cyanobacterium SU_3_3]NJL65685.1 hypothetical protein [Microcoleus sp. SM1_3_4]NJM61499.1 hypothetical protein [Oscillatoriales cyanobacterium RU_3_3]